MNSIPCKNVKHEMKLISECYGTVTLNSEQISIHRIGLDRIGSKNGAKKPSPNNYYHHHSFHIYGYFMSTISTQSYFHTADSISFLLECICISIISLQRGLARELKKAKTSIRLMFRRGDSYRLQFHMVILLYWTFVYTPIALEYLSFNNNLWCLCLCARERLFMYILSIRLVRSSPFRSPFFLNVYLTLLICVTARRIAMRLCGQCVCKCALARTHEMKFLNFEKLQLNAR